MKYESKKVITCNYTSQQHCGSAVFITYNQCRVEVFVPIQQAGVCAARNGEALRRL